LLAQNRVAVGELPEIKGTFGCSVPAYHVNFANGVFAGTDFGTSKSKVAQPVNADTVFGYRLSFGDNQRHNNVAPCVSAYLWQRTV
jgi:hypothetical protein